MTRRRWGESTLTRSAFVLERRINPSPTTIGRALSNGRELMNTLAHVEPAALLLDGPLRFVPGSSSPSWRATGQLISPRGRPVARIEVHVDLFDGDIGRLQLRPLAAHPERWGTRRLRNYFGVAHVAADQTVQAIWDTAAAPFALDVVGADARRAPANYATV
jgi:hypothetical protein